MGTAGAPAGLAQNRHDSPPHVVQGIDSGAQAGRAPPEKLRLNPVHLFQTNFFSLHLHLSCPQMCQPFWRQECKRPHIMHRALHTRRSRRKSKQIRSVVSLPRAELRDLQTLRAYQHNARTHSKRQIEQIARSIERFGFLNPVLIDGSGAIIAGHGRVEAAKLLGLARFLYCISSIAATPRNAPTSWPTTSSRRKRVGTEKSSRLSCKLSSTWTSRSS